MSKVILFIGQFNQFIKINNTKFQEMPSTLKLMSCTPINSECKKKILTIWQSIRHSNDSLQFRNPVRWQQMGLNDYLDYVKQPMDLSTIQRKLKQQKYRTVQSFLDDMQLIFDNCKTYNTSGCWIYNLADKLEKSFHKMVRNFLPKISKTNSHSKLSQEFFKKKEKQQIQKEQPEQIDQQYLQQICYNQKIKFVQKLTHLSPQNIQKQCSAAIQSTQEQSVKQKQNLKIRELVNKDEEAKNLEHNQNQNVSENQNQQEQVQNLQRVINQNQHLSDQVKSDIKSVDNIGELKIGVKFQILVDQLNLQTFRDAMEMIDHMMEQKDKVSKRIKLE